MNTTTDSLDNILSDLIEIEDLLFELDRARLPLVVVEEVSGIELEQVGTLTDAWRRHRDASVARLAALQDFNAHRITHAELMQALGLPEVAGGGPEVRPQPAGGDA